jgi:hypothetical protein
LKVFYLNIDFLYDWIVFIISLRILFRIIFWELMVEIVRLDFFFSFIFTEDSCGVTNNMINRITGGNKLIYFSPSRQNQRQLPLLKLIIMR